MNDNYSKSLAKLEIERPSAPLSIYRNYKIIVDNEVLCKIKNGETLTVQLTPKYHLLYAKIDWVKSNKLKLDFKNNEIISIQITLHNFSKFQKIFLYLLVPLGMIFGNILGGSIGTGIGAGVGGLILVSAVAKPFVQIKSFGTGRER